MFFVVQDDLIVASCSSVSEAKAVISDLRESQKIALLSKRKILRAFLKKNIPLNTSDFKIVTEVQTNEVF